MKKVFATLIALSMWRSGWAQDADKKFSLGFGINPNVSWLSALDLDVKDPYEMTSKGGKVGFSYGLMSEYHFSDNYNLAVGINHLFTGGNFSVYNAGPTKDFPQPTSTETITYYQVQYEPINLQFVQIPITLRLKTNEIGYMKYFGDLGFAGAFSFNSKTNNTVKGYQYNKETGIVEDFADGYNKNRFYSSILTTYFLVGIGGQYSLGGNSYVHMGATLNLGLGDILRKKEIEAYSNLAQNASLKNSFIGLNLGIFL